VDRIDNRGYQPGISMACISDLPQTLKIPENASFESGRLDEVTDDYFPSRLTYGNRAKRWDEEKAVRALLEDRPRTRSRMIGDNEVKKVPRVQDCIAE
jgi:hypothetical protein